MEFGLKYRFYPDKNWEYLFEECHFNYPYENVF